MKCFAIAYFVPPWKLSCKAMLNIVVLLDNTTKYSVLLFYDLKYNDNDSYSSPVPPSNGTVLPNNGTVPPYNGTVAKKRDTILRSIFSRSISIL